MEKKASQFLNSLTNELLYLGFSQNLIDKKLGKILKNLPDLEEETIRQALANFLQESLSESFDVVKIKKANKC